MTATEYTKTTEDIQQQVSVISVANHAAFAISSQGVARVPSPGPRARLSRRESDVANAVSVSPSLGDGPLDPAPHDIVNLRHSLTRHQPKERSFVTATEYIETTEDIQQLSVISAISVANHAAFAISSQGVASVPSPGPIARHSRKESDVANAFSVSPSLGERHIDPAPHDIVNSRHSLTRHQPKERSFVTATEYTKTTEDIQQQVSVISAISAASHAAFAIASRGVARVTSPGPRARLSRKESDAANAFSVSPFLGEDPIDPAPHDIVNSRHSLTRHQPKERSFVTATEYTKTTEDIQQQVSVISKISVASHAAFAISSQGVARVTSPGPRARLSRKESDVANSFSVSPSLGDGPIDPAPHDIVNSRHSMTRHQPKERSFVTATEYIEITEDIQQQVSVISAISAASHAAFAISSQGGSTRALSGPKSPTLPKGE